MARSEKPLSERIAERVKVKKPSKSYKNKAAFLAIRDDVKQAIRDDWPVKVIWETLREERKISFGYDAFINYVNRLIRRNQTDPAIEKSISINTTPLSAKTIDKKSLPPSVSGFKFEPTPNKKDLL